MLDRFCKSKGYLLKKSCLKFQTPLEVHIGPFGLPSGGTLSTCIGQDAAQIALRAVSQCSRELKRLAVNVNFDFNVKFGSSSFNDELLYISGIRLAHVQVGPIRKVAIRKVGRCGIIPGH